MIFSFYSIRTSQIHCAVIRDEISASSSLSQYLNEAKKRCLYFVLSLGMTFFVSYMFSMELVFLFVKPFLTFERSFIFTDLTEALYITMKVCAFATLYMVSPLALYQVWCFIVPSLYRAERRRWSLFWVISLFLLLVSLLMAYIVVLPKIAMVLLQFEVKRQALTIQLEARISSYINWSFKLFFVAALFCQWPVISLFASHLRLVTPLVGKRNRKAAIVVSILMAAFVSPPDFLSQWGIAACLFVWFEIIVWLRMVQRRWYRDCNPRWPVPAIEAS